MPSRAQYRHQHFAKAPRGWRVRSKPVGEHVLRFAFPPGPRRKGAGRLLEILHPKANPSCEEGSCEIAAKNPQELLIFGNPRAAWAQADLDYALIELEKARKRLRDAKTKAEKREAAEAAHFWGNKAAALESVKNPKRQLTVPERHQLRIARDTLKMSPAMARVMGGPTKEEAREIIRKLTKANPGDYVDIKLPDGTVRRFHMKKEDEFEFTDPKTGKKIKVTVMGETHREDLPKEKNPRWVRLPGSTDIYRVVEVQGGPRSRRYLLEGPHPSKARVWTRTGRVYDTAAPNRSNPDETKQAVRLFQVFHGKDPKEIVEKQRSAAMRKDYTALGDLDYLKVQTNGDCLKIDFEGDGVKLASSPQGNQLYLIGGNQNLAPCLERFTDDPSKDFLDLGEALEIQYVARKIHGGYQPVSYYHKFGEGGGSRPRAFYDKLRREVFLAGGDYFIDASVAISPGIEG